ncbi:arabinose-5-phosphate isomerase [Hydrogenispora ethanolica]|jgi:arabinose-5-phosphate isomerase|uniref:Arabinose-5-phosphate isomerase n=1 Tax=Hydrogenispora ethanolica TaxID=1082276 RepID=A0A4R1RFV6_HYDET|nr:KpsF/GutQ family sugar-phosphate isomerase [Hydrogenispora ethanolica]TCL64789.1 arabinose-5-phosphate isomerase [Hydrogenispora ethanolica]
MIREMKELTESRCVTGYLEQAKEVLRIEAEAVKTIAEELDDSFARAVELILNCSGRIVVTGMGKSGLIGRKIAATLASTGTPSFFLHPGEAVHGDLGMVTPSDIVIAISSSGEVDEVLAILPTLKIIGTPIISITGNRDSSLAQNSDLVLMVQVEKEACPLGLAPTASTTATLALGDALAVVLLKTRNFTPEDFALYHPGGSLGRKLLLTVDKLMHTGEMNPVIPLDKTVKDAVIVMTSHGNHGAAVIVGERGRLAGIITDGDLRRILKNHDNPLTLPVERVMTRNPRSIGPEKLAAEAMHVMEAKNITVLPVIDTEGVAIGIIHLHDIIKGLTGMKP